MSLVKMTTVFKQSCFLLRNITVFSVCLYIYQNLKEQQTQRTPQYDSLMQALITKMDPQLQSKLGLLSDKWIRVKEETYTWHRVWVFMFNQRLQLQAFACQVCVVKRQKCHFQWFVCHTLWFVEKQIFYDCFAVQFMKTYCS